MQDLVSWIIPRALEYDISITNYSCMTELFNKTIKSQIFRMPDYFVQLQIDKK